MSVPALTVVGLSHHTAPVALREKLAFRAEELPQALGVLTHGTGFEEAAILSTCNRVEVYAVGGPAEALPVVRAFLSSFHEVQETEFAKALYVQRDAEAARHLFEVAASLDSQVLGETEIIGQVRDAYQAAAEVGAVGPVLRAVFERALFLAKELRGEGGMSGMQASVSSAAVQLAGKVFENLASSQVLVLGTGEMAAGIVRALKSHGVQEVVIASRTQERAAAFARAAGARCAPYEQLSEYLATSDIVLVSTAAPHYILTPEHICQAHERRHGRPLFIIDISVPRNADPAVNTRGDTFLYDIDDLEAVATDGRRQREQVAALWHPRLSEEARAVFHELASPAVGETARRLLSMAREMKETELAALRNGHADAETCAQVERAFERFQNKLLHGALATLKEAARGGDGAQAAHWVARLFRLNAWEQPQAQRTISEQTQTPTLEARPQSQLQNKDGL